MDLCEDVAVSLVPLSRRWQFLRRNFGMCIITLVLFKAARNAMSPEFVSTKISRFLLSL